MPCKPPMVVIFILQIWSASPIQDVNTSAPILLALWMFITWIRNGKLVSSYWPKFSALRLFVETMPVYKAVASGNGNRLLTQKLHVQISYKLRSPQMPDWSSITVSVWTHLIVRYQLSLIVHFVEKLWILSEMFCFKFISGLGCPDPDPKWFIPDPSPDPAKSFRPERPRIRTHNTGT